MLGLAEVGVAAEVDPQEAGPPAQGDRLVDVDVGLLVRGAVAAAIDQVERLAGVGQRDDQGMIAPGAVVGDVDALLALGVGGDEGAIDVDDRLAEEVGGLLGVDPQPGGVDGLHQGRGRRIRWNRRQKSPSVVGSGMRTAPRASR